MSLPYDLRGWSWAAIAVLLVFAAASAAMAWHLFGVLGLFDAVLNGSVSDEAYLVRANEMNTLGQSLSYFTLGSMYACFVLCGIWIYRATANGVATQPMDATITPGMAVVWCLVPFANLFMPYKAMVQTWTGLHRGQQVWPVIGVAWGALWALWLVASVWSNVVSRSAEYTEDFRLGTILSLAAALMVIPAALLFAKLIKDMTDASATARVASPDTPDLKEQLP